SPDAAEAEAEPPPPAAAAQARTPAPARAPPPAPAQPAAAAAESSSPPRQAAAAAALRAAVAAADSPRSPRAARTPWNPRAEMQSASIACSTSFGDPSTTVDGARFSPAAQYRLLPLACAHDSSPGHTCDYTARAERRGYEGVPREGAGEG